MTERIKHHEPTKDDMIRAAIVTLRESLDEPEEDITSMTIHLMVRDSKDKALMPSRFEEQAKSCPFCNHEGVTVRQIDHGDNLVVFFCHCMRCKSEGPARGSRNAAITKWNQRPD